MPSIRKTEIDPNHPNLKARVLPHNNEAEQAVLGCVLLDADAPTQITAELAPSDFYSKAHAKIFEAMCNVYHRNVPVDVVTLTQELDTMGALESVGGLTYLADLSNAVPGASNYKHYVGLVKKLSTLRKLILSAQKITDVAFVGDPDDDAIAFAEREIYSLAEENDKSSLVTVQSSVGEALHRMEEMYKDPTAGRGIPTGFKGLNNILNGFQPGDLILIAARPGQGKTSIGMNFIEHAAMHASRKTAAGKDNPYKCAVFSLEMPAVQLAKRMLCSEARVDMSKANSGRLTAEDWKALAAAKSRLDKAQIYIDDSSLTTPIEILSKCRRLKREKGLDLVMVDYLQLMSSGERVENRQQEVSTITRTMKIAAKELNVPILLLSQMSRDVEKRTGKKPQMSDLRESGAIEQDADIILFIYREHDPNDVTVDEEVRSKVELIIAKHRNGETGSVELKWDGSTVRFIDVDKSKRTASLEKNIPPEKGEGNFSDLSGEPFVVSQKSTEEILSVPADGKVSDIF